MSRFDAAASAWDKADLRQTIARNVADAVCRSSLMHPSASLLDFGAGTGLLSYRLLPFVHKITALDTSKKMLEVLQDKRQRGNRIKSLHADILEAPLPYRFDGIVSSMALHHVDDTARLLRTFALHLEPGGFIALADLDREDGTFHTCGNEGVFHFGFDRGALRKLAENAGFTHIDFVDVMTIEKPAASYPLFLMTARQTN